MKTLAIEVDDRTYAEICRQASLRGVPPEEIAAERVREEVLSHPSWGETDEEIEREIAELEAAAEEMAAITAGRPHVDILALIREGREELEERAFRR